MRTGLHIEAGRRLVRHGEESVGVGRHANDPDENVEELDLDDETRSIADDERDVFAGGRREGGKSCEQLRLGAKVDVAGLGAVEDKNLEARAPGRDRDSPVQTNETRARRRFSQSAAASARPYRIEGNN